MYQFDIKSQNSVIENGLDFTFAPRGYYDRTFTIADADISNQTLNYKVDDVGRKLLRDDNGIWRSNYGKTFKNSFVSLANGDKFV